MSKFKSKKEKEIPKVSTASLPDIVFMLLFFFMVVTVIKEQDVLVDIELPKATEISKLKNPRKAEHFYIGPPRADGKNAAPVIQINDKFISIDRIKNYVIADTKESETMSVHVDKGVSMGIVSDVKIELRKAERYKLQYIAHKASEN